MSFNPADYASVDERLPLFWKDCARGRIVTELVVDDGTRIVMKAELYADIADPVTRQLPATLKKFAAHPWSIKRVP
jgi:hypothetical protein